MSTYILIFAFMSTSPYFKYIVSGIILASFMTGALVMVVLVPSTDVHYHANITLFIGGKKVNFDDPGYMQEIGKCSVDPTKQQPEDRTHFHNNDGGLVHVHAAGVTWGHLMSNIGWDFGQSYLVDDKGKLYQNSASGSIHFILNGRIIDNPFNRLIQSEDRLLIDYGRMPSEALIKTEFAQVPETAHAANEKDDPASCGGTSAYSMKETLHHFFGKGGH